MAWKLPEDGWVVGGEGRQAREAGFGAGQQQWGF